MIDAIILSANPLLVAGVGPALAVCTGGTIIDVGTRRIHIFTASGTFGVVVPPINVDYLVVAGGGGGGGGDGGGGGAGGLLAGTLAFTAGNKTVTVGAGGPGGVTTAQGAQGANSVLDAITAIGGGGGGAASVGTTGGSGGGASSRDGTGRNGSAGTAGQGTAGGNSQAGGPNYTGGGGGGAGSGGGHGTATVGGTGGPGAASSISGAAVAYAGGGGGGTYDGGTAGGGQDGGGSGSNDSGITPGTAGTANTGGGGGGGSRNNAGTVNSSGGEGGSGIVIVSYELSTLVPALVPSETYFKELSVGEFGDEQYELRDIGGFYSCQFKVVLPPKEWAIEFLNNGVGRMIRIYSEKSHLVWEGFVNTVEMKIGSATIRCSLTDMTNRVWARYQPLGGGAVARSANQENIPSQTRWGIKEEILNSGQVDLAEADQRAQAYLRQYYWAKPELEGIRLGSQTEDIVLTIHGLGYWHTLGWRVYNQTAATGTANATQVVSDIVTAIGQFVKSTEYDGNGTTVTKVYDADRRGKDIIESICDLGDPEYHLFVAGMEADRHFYYRQAAPAERAPV